MTITEALKIRNEIRRKGNPIHAGSHGDGWVDIEFILHDIGVFALRKEDLLADDWEVKPEPKPKMLAYWQPFIPYYDGKLEIIGKNLIFLPANAPCPDRWIRAPEHDE